MASGKRVNVTEVIDKSRLGRFQWVIFVLCGLSLIMDGYNVQIMGYVAPVLRADWNISQAVLGSVFSTALFGVLFGSLLSGVIADKVGRRPVLVTATLYFAVFSLLTGLATSVPALLWFRFLSGLGLGAIMPNAMSLVGEYSPARLRVMVMMVVSCGLTAGGVVVGFVAAWIIPAFGWRAVFFVGAAIPFVVGLLMLFWLPESPQFLAIRGNRPSQLGRLLQRLEPGVPTGSGVDYVVHEQKKQGVPVVHLFHEGRGPTTLMFWVLNFMNLLNLYLLSSWIPTVVHGIPAFAGDPKRAGTMAVLVGTTLQIGGLLGSFGNAWFIGKIGFMRALAGCFAVACISIACIGQPGLPLVLLFAVVFVAGWCIVGGQPGINTLAGIYYPTYLRSTGIGWGLGIGRIGAVVGPLIVGELLRRHWPTQDVFYIAAVPAAISVITMFGLRKMESTPAVVESGREALVH